MKKLDGLNEYKSTGQPPSIFDELAASSEQTVFHCCNGFDLVGTVANNATYELTFTPENAVNEQENISMAKVEILCVYKPADREKFSAQTKIKQDTTPTNPAAPLIKNVDRHHIKNKTLYPLMKERQVMRLTLLDGTILAGLATGFNKHEIRMSLKGGIAVTVLRHGVLSAETKAGRSLLKRDQEKFRDWKKSPLYMEQPAPTSSKQVIMKDNAS